MKYEITKGSEKDFEGAPEWAVLVYKSTVRCFVGSHGEWKNEDSTCIYNNFERHAGISFGEKLIAERRPITEPVVWLNLDECDGSEYLGPLIGKEMECHAKDGSIFEVVVVAFDGDLPIVKTRLHGNYFGCDPSQLKPIRSPEDAARDEEIVLLTDVICGKIPDVGVATAAMFAGRVYDAGYRRPKPHTDEVQACEHKSTRTSAGGCICNDCGWRSW